ncbi:g12692 [Coccomyxa viridis]|uniref:G12692 protein n=1 Tax=Coccomyxa viridis TaxID=1274662 RepID=A0ABP1GI02_9CHLO
MESASCDIAFSDLRFTIQSGKETLRLLQGVSGACRSGRLTAILGPSGSSKTTLLKFLAGCISGGKQDGTVLINGTPVRDTAFKSRLALVWQSDILLPTATVREAVLTSALLRLPSSMSRAQKESRVDHILEELDLARVKDHLIGQDIDGTMSGISGGERRRVSVGISLVTDAQAIFLDEPTTGLDSESAETLMQLLARLAQKRGITVVCTIHQPSSDICSLFDDAMLLSGGKMLYNGSWEEAETYMAIAGFGRPLQRNLAEHLLWLAKDRAHAVPNLAKLHTLSWKVHSALEEANVTGVDSAHVLQEILIEEHESTLKGKGVIEVPSPASVLHVDYLSDTCSRSSSQPTEESASSSTPVFWDNRSDRSGKFEGVDCSGKGASHLRQTGILCARFARSWLRSPVSLSMQALQYGIAAALMGAMYYRLPGDVSAGVYDRVASLWFVGMVVIFMSGNSALTISYTQKPLLRREVYAGHYSYLPYYIAKTLTTLPLQLAYATLYVLMTYFLVGYQVAAANFFYYAAIIFLLILISETLGMLCSGAFRAELTGAIVLQAIYVPLLMFVGFFQTTTPPCFEWLKRISYATYGYSALVKNEFSGLTLQEEGGFYTTDASELIPTNIQTGFSLGANAAILISILVGLRIVQYIQMRIIIAAKFL